MDGQWNGNHEGRKDEMAMAVDLADHGQWQWNWLTMDNGQWQWNWQSRQWAMDGIGPVPAAADDGQGTLCNGDGDGGPVVDQGAQQTLYYGNADGASGSQADPCLWGC